MQRPGNRLLRANANGPPKRVRIILLAMLCTACGNGARRRLLVNYEEGARFGEKTPSRYSYQRQRPVLVKSKNIINSFLTPRRGSFFRAEVFGFREQAGVLFEANSGQARK